MMNALSTTRCLFIGLSMRDINFLRWLGASAAEHEATWRDRWRLHFISGDDTLRKAASWLRRPKNAHKWLEDDPDQVLVELLRLRGIDLVSTDWSRKDPSRFIEQRLREHVSVGSSAQEDAVDEESEQ